MYTLMHCTFDSNGKIKTLKDVGLEPMTREEAQTMKSRMMKPNEWLVSKVLK